MPAVLSRSDLFTRLEKGHSERLAVDRSGEDFPGVYPGAFNPNLGIPSVFAAIKMHTINSAWQLHMERDVGSIEVGKYADLIVLNQDPFSVPTERVSETKVVQTILGGTVVYSADPAGTARAGTD